jgi:hypothetical protein
MKNAPSLNTGDRVRVVLEGEIHSTSHPQPSYFCLGGRRSGFNAIHPIDDHVVSVEVLPKPVRLGDTVAGAAYNALPPGTVVSAGPGTVDLFKTVSGWVDSIGHTHGLELTAPRTVVFLPDASA